MSAELADAVASIIDQFPENVSKRRRRDVVQLGGELDVLAGGQVPIDARLLGHVPDTFGHCVRFRLDVVPEPNINWPLRSFVGWSE